MENSRQFAGSRVLGVIHEHVAPKSNKSSFTCNALEGEQVKFSWTKNGKIIHQGGRIGILSGDETSTFIIKDATTGDSGEYTCIASNDVSEDRSSAKLIVKGDSRD
ncbi:titin-like [Tropilaelaps mercedesae]|uniref:Titin-like n=1 Tax=Tropilaelaps mercedesae TaxID=418985 RepID=A0A1V9Y1R7_9ACAR|nr:titin-like [Tropilaelaps mercedesae]